MADKVFDFLISYFSNMNDRGIDEMNHFRGDITSNEVVKWLKKVQNISIEQSSKDLEKAATALTNEIVGELNVGDYTDHSGHNAHWHSFKEGVIAGTQWQKEQDKALIERAEDHAKLAGIALGEKEAKEKFINKACEWLKENIYNRVYKYNDSLGFPTAAFLEEFKKAMEE